MLELYINNQLADLKEETLITVTKQYESVSNPTLYYADFSKTVKLQRKSMNQLLNRSDTEWKKARRMA